MVTSLRSSVTKYIDHLQDASWVESLVSEYGLVGVLGSCVEVLAEQHPNGVHEVATLLRDIGIRGIVNDNLVLEVRKLMPAIVLPALRPLLRAPALQVRMTAIYTIGKLSFPGEAKALREVFPSYLDRDPLCLPRLLFELGWLGDRRGVHARLKRIILHQSYLVRWSALGYLDCSATPSGRELRLRMQWLGTLASDSARLVADEARHRIAELELEVTGRKAKWWPKAEWRAKRRALEHAEPMTFSTLEIRFLNQVARDETADYRLEELDAFARSIEKFASQRGTCR